MLRVQRGGDDSGMADAFIDMHHVWILRQSLAEQTQYRAHLGYGGHAGERDT